jgi:uncharacterized protein with PIN domain
VVEKFIADAHLGKLARYLRLLGIDTAYKNFYTAKELIATAIVEDRIILTRSEAFESRKAVRSVVIQSEDPFMQLKQVALQFELKDYFQPFSRCLLCNGNLQAVLKEKLSNSLEENTRNYFNEFWQCDNCNHVYWKGSHYNKMLRTIEEIEKHISLY